jgi:hypothetical protein
MKGSVCLASLWHLVRVSLLFRDTNGPKLGFGAHDLDRKLARYVHSPSNEVDSYEYFADCEYYRTEISLLTSASDRSDFPDIRKFDPLESIRPESEVNLLEWWRCRASLLWELDAIGGLKNLL